MRDPNHRDSSLQSYTIHSDKPVQRWGIFLEGIYQLHQQSITNLFSIKCSCYCLYPVYLTEEDTLHVTSSQQFEIRKWLELSYFTVSKTEKHGGKSGKMFTFETVKWLTTTKPYFERQSKHDLFNLRNDKDGQQSPSTLPIESRVLSGEGIFTKQKVLQGITYKS